MLQRDDPVPSEPPIAPEPVASLPIGLSTAEPGTPVLGPPEAPDEPALTDPVEPLLSFFISYPVDLLGEPGLVLSSAAPAAPASASVPVSARMVRFIEGAAFLR